MYQKQPNSTLLKYESKHKPLTNYCCYKYLILSLLNVNSPHRDTLLHLSIIQTSSLIAPNMQIHRRRQSNIQQAWLIARQRTQKRNWGHTRASIGATYRVVYSARAGLIEGYARAIRMEREKAPPKMLCQARARLLLGSSTAIIIFIHYSSCMIWVKKFACSVLFGVKWRHVRMGRRSILVMDDFGPRRTLSLGEWCESVYNVAGPHRTLHIMCSGHETREGAFSPDKKGVRAASGYTITQNVRRARTLRLMCCGCSNAAINPSWWSFNQLAFLSSRAFARSIELH